MVSAVPAWPSAPAARILEAPRHLRGQPSLSSRAASLRHPKRSAAAARCECCCDPANSCVATARTHRRLRRCRAHRLGRATDRWPVMRASRGPGSVCIHARACSGLWRVGSRRGGIPGYAVSQPRPRDRKRCLRCPWWLQTRSRRWPWPLDCKHGSINENRRERALRAAARAAVAASAAMLEACAPAGAGSPREQKADRNRYGRRGKAWNFERTGRERKVCEGLFRPTKLAC